MSASEPGLGNLTGFDLWGELLNGLGYLPVKQAGGEEREEGEWKTRKPLSDSGRTSPFDSFRITPRFPWTDGTAKIKCPFPFSSLFIGKVL